MYRNCPVCKKKILRHAYQIKCSHCNELFHLKCITLSQSEMHTIMQNQSSWLCMICMEHIFPFNHVQDDDLFIETLADFLPSNKNSLCFLSDKIFQPFDFEEYLNPMDDIDEGFPYSLSKKNLRF